MSEKPKGFIPVMLTPFKENGAVDYDGLTELTELYLQAGASGLFANCLSSEMFELTPEERLAVTRHVVKVSGGTVPVVATATFGGKIQQQADFVKRMHDTGIEAAIVITNMLAGELESADVFDDRFMRLLDATPGIPLGFYECPDPYKRVLSAAQLQQFVETGRVIYHKDTCLDLALIKAKIDATSAFTDFALYDAHMAHAVKSLEIGSAGVSCIQGNYFPELIVWLCKYFDRDAMRYQVDSVQQFLIDNMAVMHTVYPLVAKYFLEKRGLGISHFTRRYAGVFDSKVRDEVDGLYHRFAALCQHIDLKLTG